MTLLCLGTEIVLMVRPPPAVWHIMRITGILVTMRMMHKVHISRTVPSVRTVHIARLAVCSRVTAPALPAQLRCHGCRARVGCLAGRYGGAFRG